jgi:hypothetical protein
MIALAVIGALAWVVIVLVAWTCCATASWADEWDAHDAGCDIASQVDALVCSFHDVDV